MYFLLFVTFFGLICLLIAVVTGNGSIAGFGFGFIVAATIIVYSELHYNYRKEREFKKLIDEAKGPIEIPVAGRRPTKWWYFWETL